MFINLMERGQNLHPELFTTGVFVGNFSIRRSPRRGATTEAENNNMYTVDIELIIRWGGMEAERRTESGI